MKRLISVIGIGVFILCACSCVSKAEFESLESRVDALEQNNITSTSGLSGDSSEHENSDLSTIELKNYVTNYDEVITIIQQEFSNGIKDVRDSGTYTPEDLGALKEFGTGQYIFYVNDVCVLVRCEYAVAYRVDIDIGGKWKKINTPTGDSTYESRMERNING